jgi:hypothetical protein
VARHNTFTTDSQSQGYLTFADPYSNKAIATVFIRSDSVLTLNSASRPRFSFSDNAYAIRLTGVNGNFEVWVAVDLDREIRLDIEGLLGTTRIGEGGTFLIESSPSSMTVTVRGGRATLITPDRRTRHLDSSTRGTILVDNPEIAVGPGPVDLLPNSNFGLSEDWPEGWRCYSEADDPGAPRGDFEIASFDGRATYHLARLDGSDPVGHGETGCLQYPADKEQGLDVRQYDDLHLRVSMLVHTQSLSACGVLGSECPVMLYMQYKDKDGNIYDWYHGFYAQYTPNVGRTTCDSCREEHEKINEDAWYTYESGNLFNNLPVDRHPAAIILVKFYASGHEYDVMLNEVSLVATPLEDAAAG